MTSNVSFERELFDMESFVYKRRRKLKKHNIARAKKRNMLFLILSLSFITISAFYITHNIYISRNSKDLEFSVEYNFTSGFLSNNKLLRVQKMSLVYYDSETAIVEASGLAKDPPHKNTTLKGSFKKGDNKSWYLEKILAQ